MQMATSGTENKATTKTPVLLGAKQGSTAKKRVSRSHPPHPDSLETKFYLVAYGNSSLGK